MRVYWPDEAIAFLQTGEVISLGLGDDARGTGNDVVLWIEENVVLPGFIPPKIRVHSANCKRQDAEGYPKHPPFQGSAMTLQECVQTLMDPSCTVGVRQDALATILAYAFNEACELMQKHPSTMRLLSKRLQS